MQTLLRISLVIISTIAIISCKQSHQQFNQKIDENIQLESTILGVSVIADSLDVPWEILWGPDDWIWVTEQKGIVSRINPTSGEKKVLLTLTDIWMKRTSGLLGMIVHPDQKNSI